MDMATTEQDGIVFFDKPKTVDYLEFLFDHIGCDMIITMESADRGNTNDVVAFASSKEKNPTLRRIFKTRYNNGKYLIHHHISEEQANGIF